MRSDHTTDKKTQCVFLFNGPPRSGKTTASKMLQDIFLEQCKRDALSGGHIHLYEHSTFMSFLDTQRDTLFPVVHLAEPLKAITHRLYKTSRHEYETCKDVPSSDFGSLTPRQAYIDVSTSLKEHLGGTVFVDALLRKMEGIENFIVADLGFISELNTFLKRVPKVVLIRMHRIGTNFNNDSRSYLDHDTVFDLHNGDSLECLKDGLRKIASVM